MKTMFGKFLSAYCGILVIVTAGCSSTMTIKSPSQPFTGYASGQKLPLSVGLQLTDEFRKAQIERSHLGSKFVIPVGQNLCMNAETMSKTLFTEVQVGSKSTDFKTDGTRAVLIPKVAYASYVNMAGLVSIKLEWTLMDRQGNPIWAGTSGGEGRRKSIIMYNPEDTVKEALDNLFNNSQKLLSTAPEIRQFSTSR